MKRHSIPIKGRVSLIIPCFNERDRLPEFLNDLAPTLIANPQLELWVVDDGSDPGQMEPVIATVNQLKFECGVKITILRQAVHVGKGAALHAGFSAATAPIVGFVDADGSIPPEEISRLASELTNARAHRDDLSAVLGSRIRLLGNDVERPSGRFFVGRIFAWVMHRLFAIPSYDTQCGVKFFVRDRITPLLEYIQSRTWLWDTELVLLLYLTGNRLREIPISWKEKSGSKISFVRDPIRMFWGLWKFRKYLSRVPLRELARAPETESPRRMALASSKQSRVVAESAQTKRSDRLPAKRRRSR